MFCDHTRDNLVSELVHRWQQSEDNVGFFSGEQVAEASGYNWRSWPQKFSKIVLCKEGLYFSDPYAQSFGTK